MFTNLVCWVAVGLIAGMIASRFVNERGDDPKLGIMLGGVGAVIGGIVFSLFTASGMSAFKSGSLLAAAIGAVVALLSWHSIRRFVSRT